MEFKKYQHLERLGNEEVQGINEGEVYIFPKIDGTNSSVWYEDGKLHCGSRNRELSLDKDNQGFMAHIMENHGKYTYFFSKHPAAILYGEWLVPHSLKTYRKDAWRKFYVFDVVEYYEHVHYKDYKSSLEINDIEFIPPLAMGTDLSEEAFKDMAEKNNYLIDEGIGEGIVIKNYDYTNKYGRTVWAKIVRNEFKDKHRKAMGPQEIIEKESVERKIVDYYITEALVEKTYHKVKPENGWNSKLIPKLFSFVFHDLIVEESWNFIKKFKKPSIDFKQLELYTIRKIKEIKPELF